LKDVKNGILHVGLPNSLFVSADVKDDLAASAALKLRQSLHHLH
jgi:hypothetical protein